MASRGLLFTGRSVAARCRMCVAPPGLARLTATPMPALQQFTANSGVRWYAKKQKKVKEKKEKKGKAAAVQDEDGEEVEAISTQDIITMVDGPLTKAVEAMKRKHAALRTGRASATMFDELTIEAYGAPMPMSAVASTSVRGPQLVVVIPHDPTQADAISRGIQNCGMSLNPEVQNNKTIQIKIPKMNKQVRTDMAKQVKTSAEDCKNRIRRVRQDVMSKIKKNSGSDDQQKQHEKHAQGLIDGFVSQVDELAKDKDAEISGGDK